MPRHEKFWIPQRALNQLEVSEISRETKDASSLTLENSQLDNPENIRDTNSSDRTSQKVKLPKLNTQPDEDDRDDNEDSDDESESDFVRNDHWANVVDDFNNVVTGLKRKFSTFAISDESDADTSSSESESESDSDSDTAIDYHSQLSRSPSGTASRPQAPLERPQISETRTTQWVSKIAGNLFGRTLEPVKTSEDQLTGELALTKYREAISQARNTAEEFLRQNRVEAMEIEYRAGDDVLVKLGGYFFLFCLIKELTWRRRSWFRHTLCAYCVPVRGQSKIKVHSSPIDILTPLGKHIHGPHQIL